MKSGLLLWLSLLKGLLMMLVCLIRWIGQREHPQPLPKTITMRGPSSRPPLRISQATFDDAVASNMEAFEHERPEAVAAARAQFAAAGVDLSNIVDSVEDASTPASAALAALAILMNVLGLSPAADDDQHGALLSDALRGGRAGAVRRAARSGARAV